MSESAPFPMTILHQKKKTPATHYLCSISILLANCIGLDRLCSVHAQGLALELLLDLIISFGIASSSFVAPSVRLYVEGRSGSNRLHLLLLL